MIVETGWALALVVTAVPAVPERDPIIVWIPAISDGAGVTDGELNGAFRRAVALFGTGWRLESPPARPCDGMCATIEIRGDRARYRLELEEPGVTQTVSTTVGLAEDTPVFSIAQALVLECAFLLERLQRQPIPVAKDAWPAPAPEPPLEQEWLRLTIGAGLASGQGEGREEEYRTFGPELGAAVRLAGSVWLRLLVGAHIRGGGESNAESEYQVRAVPISLHTGGRWSRGRWSWGASGGVAAELLWVRVESGVSRTEMVWGASFEGQLGYELAAGWTLEVAFRPSYFADEVDIDDASLGDRFRLPNLLWMMSAGVSCGF